jgi:hypothetical protein
LVEALCYKSEVADPFPMKLLDFYIAEMSTRNLLGSKGLPALKADNLTAVCEQIVKKV